MSDFVSSPIDIPKKYTKSKFSFNVPPSDSTKLLFELEIEINNKKKNLQK